MPQRYYDPAIGRFLSLDKIGFAGGLNEYAYSGNDPVNEADPNGLNPLLPVLAAGSHEVAVAAGVVEGPSSPR